MDRVSAEDTEFGAAIEWLVVPVRRRVPRNADASLDQKGLLIARGGGNASYTYVPAIVWRGDWSNRGVWRPQQPRMEPKKVRMRSGAPLPGAGYLLFSWSRSVSVRQAAMAVSTATAASTFSPCRIRIEAAKQQYPL